MLVLPRVTTALSIIGTATVLIWAMKYCSYGIDFTDEGFYLVWLSNPFLYDISASQFGFIYHPLYVALGGNIAELRQANILINFGLGWVLVCVFLVSLAPEVRESRLVLNTVAAGIGTSTIVILNTWLPTPNYNGLAFQSLLVTCIGLIWAERNCGIKSLFGWGIIGLGGWLTFMAKPSTASALGIVVLVFLVASRKFSFRPFLLTLATAVGLLLLSALLIDGSVSGFVERIFLGVDAGRMMGGGHTVSQMLRIDSFRLRTPGKRAILLMLVIVSLAMIWASSRRPGAAITSFILSAIFLAVTAVLALGMVHKTTGLGEYEGILILGVALPAAFTGLLLGKLSPLKSLSTPHWAMAVLFVVIPYIYAFGTNRNYWQNAVWVGIFWLLSGMTLLGPVMRERLTLSFMLPLTLATQATTAVLLNRGLEQPQRQDQPLRLNESVVEIGTQRSNLILSPTFAAYLADAKAVARSGGFRPHTPLIDLSGRSPGVLYALGAESIGQAWTIGGYPGSLALAEAALKRVSCEKIAVAWVLFEPDGPNSIPTEVMPALGAAFPGNYRRVGTWQAAEGIGGFDGRRTQELYEPIRSAEVLESCRSLRSGT